MSWITTLHRYELPKNHQGNRKSRCLSQVRNKISADCKSLPLWLGEMIFPGRFQWLPKALASFANVVWPHWGSPHKCLSFISYYHSWGREFIPSTKNLIEIGWSPFGSVQFHLIIPWFKIPLQINIVLIWWSVCVIGNCSSPLPDHLCVSHVLWWLNLLEVFPLGFLDFYTSWSDPQGFFISWLLQSVSHWCVLAVGWWATLIPKSESELLPYPHQILWGSGKPVSLHSQQSFLGVTFHITHCLWPCHFVYFIIVWIFVDYDSGVITIL